TTVTIALLDAAKFPQPTGAEFFTAALENTGGDIEIVTCTDNNVGTGVLTVVRAQEATVEADFLLAVSRIECRSTGGVMASFLQAAEAIFTADADLGGNSLINGEVVGVPLRGATGDTSNQLVVPSGGARPTIGGIDILIATDALIPPNIIGMWSGLIVDIPTDWALCDGGFGTPDLSAQFIVSYADGDPDFGTVGNQGGNPTATDDAGAHAHGGTVDDKLLLESDIPTLTLATHSAVSDNGSDNHNQTNRAAAGASNSSLTDSTNAVE
ncbi:unnamed protein product, partial [marine sediment metagenome]